MTLSADCCKIPFCDGDIGPSPGLELQIWSNDCRITMMMIPAFMTKYEPLCQGGVAKSSPRWRGSWRGSTSKMAKVDLKLHSLLKAWMQAFLVFSLSTGWLRGYPPKTSPRNIHANFRIEIQNHTLNVIARIFRELRRWWK